MSHAWLSKSSFRNVVVEHGELESGFQATVRSNADSKDQIRKWLDELENSTNTRWILRNTQPGLQRLAYRADFVCQHSSFNKSSGSNRASKNCECRARVTAKIKIVSRNTKATDPHIKVCLHAAS